MTTYKSSRITDYPLPPVGAIGERSIHKIRVALAKAKKAVGLLETDAEEASDFMCRARQQKSEALRLLRNKLGILEVMLREPTFTGEIPLVLDCLSMMRINGDDILRRQARGLIMLARETGLVEPLDRYGRFSLR
jgi:hypothetical protein